LTLHRVNDYFASMTQEQHGDGEERHWREKAHDYRTLACANISKASRQLLLQLAIEADGIARGVRLQREADNTPR
jgi:hypothetical protein